MHIVKNYLVELGAFDKFTKVPLILGVWGEKGMGKSFQTELALKKLGWPRAAPETLLFSHQAAPYNSTLALNLEPSLQPNTLIVNHYKTVLGLGWLVSQPLVAQARILLALSWQSSLAEVLAWLSQPRPWPCWAQLQAQPWCACCAWLAGECWAQALRLLAVWLPGCCVGPVGAYGGPVPGTTSCPALAGHAAGSRLGALSGGAPDLLGASSLQAWWPYACSAASHRAAGHSLLS
ncbi:ATPase_AAA_core domain-containing protein, partial [Haematococcus lacustris]